MNDKDLEQRGGGLIEGAPRHFVAGLRKTTKLLNWHSGGVRRDSNRASPNTSPDCCNNARRTRNSPVV
jgi:hypothetical protein